MFSTDWRTSPAGWLHCADGRCAVPKTACYWQGSHGKYVRVEPDGVSGLSQFLLVIQGIARVSYDTLYYPRPRTRQIIEKIRIDPTDPNVPPPNPADRRNQDRHRHLVR